MKIEIIPTTRKTTASKQAKKRVKDLATGKTRTVQGSKEVQKDVSASRVVVTIDIDGLPARPKGEATPARLEWNASVMDRIFQEIHAARESAHSRLNTARLVDPFHGS